MAEENAADAIEKPLTMDAFAEDWNESQFWYEDETARTLAEELLKGAGPEVTIGVVSAPSVFIQLKNILVGFFRLFASHFSPFGFFESAIFLLGV